LYSGTRQNVCKPFLESHISVLVTMIWLLSLTPQLYGPGDPEKPLSHFSFLTTPTAPEHGHTNVLIWLMAAVTNPFKIVYLHLLNETGI
jgi:hypothetical protein